MVSDREDAYAHGFHNFDSGDVKTHTCHGAIAVERSAARTRGEHDDS